MHVFCSAMEEGVWNLGGSLAVLAGYPAVRQLQTICSQAEEAQGASSAASVWSHGE